MVLEDCIFLFTKNWEDQHTNLYAQPAAPGSYSPLRRATFDTQGLITGASKENASGTIALIGYTQLGAPFVWSYPNYSGKDLFRGISLRRGLELGIAQTESSTWIAPEKVYITYEALPNGTAKLFRSGLDLDVSSGN